MSITITVELGERSYPIHIGSGIIDDGARVAAAVPSNQVVIITNEIVAPLYLARLRAQLADRQCFEYVLPDGEAHKTLESFERIMGYMLERRIERSASVVALGGGVVGDLAGFVASCYQRGVHYVQVPTTLLAQVDSAVGGKTAVNHPLGKNMIGAFYQPRAVLADTGVLATLPTRELSAGLAEVIKYGLIGDEAFLSWLEANIGRLIARERDALMYAVRRSCENKAAVVAGDERESGARALLNLGHTFGHAIETAMGYGSWLHGEAVGAGICMAARMSARLGWLSGADVERVTALIARAGLPTAAPREIDVATFREHMSRDKKNEGGHVRLILLRAIGNAVITSDYPQTALSSVLSGAA